MSVVEVWSMINGTRVNHTHGSGNNWVASGTAPIKSSYSQPNHTYTVTTYAKDDADNVETYETQLKVVEKNTTGDYAGKTTTVTRHVTLDTGVPEFTSVTITPNPADAGASITITAIVTD